METRCPHCQAKFNVRDNAKGLKTKCLKCHQLFVIGESVHTTSDNMVPHDTISVVCTKCMEELQVTKKMLGHRDVCDNCKKVTLITKLTRKQISELVERKAELEKKSKTFQGFGRGAAVTAIFSYAVLEAGRKIPKEEAKVLIFIAVILGCVAVVFGILSLLNIFIFKKISQLEQTLGTEINSKEEKKRQEVYDTILELRKTGKIARLCDKCLGARKSGFLEIKCSECEGHGYLEQWPTIY